MLVFVGSGLLLTVRHYAALNVIFVVVWLALVAAVAHEHRKLLSAAPHA
jgi:hypothetical protein